MRYCVKLHEIGNSFLSRDMRRLIADVYKFLYKFLRIKSISIFIAVIYIAVLNLITAYGLCMLLLGIYPMLEYGLILFQKPYLYGSALLAIAINFLLMLPLGNLDKERNKPLAITPLLLYTVSALILFIYARYAERIFG